MNSNLQIIFKSKFSILVIILVLILVSLLVADKNNALFFASPLPKSGYDLIQEFSGIYYMGDGLGVNCHFEIRPDETFTIRWTSDMHTNGDGGERAVYHGSIFVKDLQFVLEPSVKAEMSGLCFHRNFKPINWGERKYLLPDDNDEFSKEINFLFCNYVKNGYEPRSDIHGLSYLRTTDITLKARGYPIRQDGQLQCP